MTHFSPWPCQLGLSSLSFISSMIILFKTGVWSLVLFSLLSSLFCFSLWCKDMVFESMSGEYSFQMYDNLKLALILFIMSEGMLLVSLLWSLLHLALSPSVWVGHMCPSMGVISIPPMGLPLINTTLLVSSGVTITWGHHLVLSGRSKSSVKALSMTMSLGVMLLLNQLLEFQEASFTVSDSAYGSVLLVLTGLHGCHVLLGLWFIFISSCILLLGGYTCASHVSLELAIWYWHLVDCVWLLVYSVVYWWGM